MAAIVLTLTLSVIVAGCVWLAFGSRLALHEDSRQNDVLNLMCYGAAFGVPMFFVVFFALEHF